MKQVIQGFVYGFIPMLLIIIFVLPAIARVLTHSS